MHHDFFLVSNQTIAFGFDGNALVCDSPSRIVHSVAVPPGMVFMALDSTGGFITVHISGGTDQQAEVEADSDSESESNYVPIDDARLLVSRYSMNGSLPPSFVSSTLLPIPDPNHFSNIPDHSTDLALAKNTTLLTLSNNKLGVLTVARRQNRQIHCFFFLSHDPLSNRLSLHPSPADYNLASPVAPIGRNLLYYLKFDAWRPYIRICNSDESPPFTHSRYMYTRRVSADITSSSYAIDGDGEFVLLIDRDGVTAWCFDELASLAPAGSGG